jgi:hypothetical protein
LDNVIRFPGKGLPTTHFNAFETTLFVPFSQYPGADFFIWDTDKQTLSGFQVTITIPFTKHKKFNSRNVMANIDLWKSYCNTQTIELHWIIPRMCWAQSKTPGDRVAFFHDIYKELDVTCFQAIGNSSLDI